MRNIILLSQRIDDLADFLSGLSTQSEASIQAVTTPEEMLQVVREEGPSLVVLDETLSDPNPLDLVMNILSINAMVNTAMITSMDPEAWHEKSEGLGMLPPVPNPPSAADARDLLDTLQGLADGN